VIVRTTEPKVGVANAGLLSSAAEPLSEGIVFLIGVGTGRGFIVPQKRLRIAGYSKVIYLNENQRIV